MLNAQVMLIALTLCAHAYRLHAHQQEPHLDQRKGKLWSVFHNGPIAKVRNSKVVIC
jgi:hypothetical protein